MIFVVFFPNFPTRQVFFFYVEMTLMVSLPLASEFPNFKLRLDWNVTTEQETYYAFRSITSSRMQVSSAKLFFRTIDRLIESCSQHRTEMWLEMTGRWAGHLSIPAVGHPGPRHSVSEISLYLLSVPYFFNFWSHIFLIGSQWLPPVNCEDKAGGSFRGRGKRGK